MNSRSADLPTIPETELSAECLRRQFPDGEIVPYLLRPENAALLKSAWSAYTRSKQKEHRGGRPKGKKRSKATGISRKCVKELHSDCKSENCACHCHLPLAAPPAIPGNSECADCPNIKCESCPNRPATPEHLSDCVDPLCGGCR